MRRLSRRRSLRLAGSLVIPASLGGCSGLNGGSPSTTTTQQTTPEGYDIRVLSRSQNEHSLSIELRDDSGSIRFERTLDIGSEGSREFDSVIPVVSGQYTVVAQLDAGAERSFQFTLEPGQDSFHGLLVIITRDDSLRLDPILS